jgi:hypothetical protein
VMIASWWRGTADEVDTGGQRTGGASLASETGTKEEAHAGCNVR